MNISFKNKVALITGSSSGIGKSTAIEFARSGAKVVVHYNNNRKGADGVLDEIKAIGGKAIAIRGDLTVRKDIEQLINETINVFGSIDILVNNAGTLIDRKNIADMSEELWDQGMNVNLKSVFLCIQLAIPHIKKQKVGRIINVSSIAARNGGGLGAGHYSAAKAAVIALTKNLAKELAPNILVNAIAPGVIATPYHDKFSTDEAMKNFVENTPLKKEGRPEEVAYAILFLASEGASFITGETLEINGGMLMD